MRRSLLLFASVGVGWLVGCGARTGEDELLTSDLSFDGGSATGGESGSGGSPESGGTGGSTGGVVSGGAAGAGGIETGGAPDSGGAGGSGGTGVGNCCDDRRESGCSVPAIEGCVCGLDEYCCESGWDRQCVLEAREFCGVDCSAPGTGGAGGSGGAGGAGGTGGLPASGGRPGSGGQPGTGGAGGTGGTGGGGSPGTGGFFPGTGGFFPGTGGAPPGGEDGETCCQSRAEPGCSDPGIAACVCQGDPFCCQSAWDNLCVQEAGQCGATCGGAVCLQLPNSCQSCACDSCYVSLTSCFANEGCTCVLTTGCSGVGCLDPNVCGPFLTGPGALDSITLAVGLASCTQTSNCGCF